MASNDVFTPGSKTLRKIFGDTDAFYQVPDYQRPYRWQDDHVEQLWDDLYSSFKNWLNNKTEDDTYFLGSIILIKNRSSDHYDIVDGQQRLTTLTILFSVIRDTFSNLSPKILNTIKNSIVSITEDKQRLRFTTSIDKQNDFVHTIINGITFPARFTAADKKKNLYMNTALIFREKVKDFQVEEIEQFINYTLDHVCLISITCNSPSVAIRLFQVLNARGLDLSAADLIKSYLMNKLADENLRDQFVASWRQIEGIANDVQQEMNELLNYYLHAVKAANPEKGLFEELTELLKDQDSNKTIFDIKNFCEAYRSIYNSEDKNIYALFYLRHELYWKSILTSAAAMKFSDLIGLGKVLRNYYYVHWIAGYSSVKVKQPSFRILQMLKDGSSLSQIKAHLNSLITPEVKDRFKRALCQDVYYTQWFKPLLLVLEYEQVEQPLNYIELDNKIHVEHILPERYKKYDYWKDLFTPEQADLYLNSLANFTLLSGKQNILASNNPFPDKMFIYEGKGKDGLVPFRLSQWIRDQHNQGMKDWNIDSLKKRFAWMIENISRVFEVDLTDINFDNIGKYEEVFQYVENSFDSQTDSAEPASFHSECMQHVEKKLNIQYNRFTTTMYKSSDSTAICKVSKEYTRSGKGYWYGFTAGEKELLSESPEKNLLILGLGDPKKTLVIPAKWILEKLGNLNVTVRPNNMYWHVHIEDKKSRLFLTYKGGDEVEVSSFLMK